MVEIAMSPSRSFSSRQRAASNCDSRARLPQPLDDAFAHFGGGLSGEGDREDVIGFDAGAQQVDVALDEHTRLAGPGGRLEHDVRGIDGVDAPCAGDAATSVLSNGRRQIADIVLPAHGGEAARLAAEDVVGCRRELAALDRVQGVREPLLRSASERLGPAVPLVNERHDPFRPLEGQVHGFAERPLRPRFDARAAVRRTAP